MSFLLFWAALHVLRLFGSGLTLALCLAYKYSKLQHIATVLRQAIGQLQSAGSRFAPSYCGSALLSCVKLLGNCSSQGFALIGRMQFRVSCLVSRYCGITICRVLLCFKLLENYNLQGFAGFALCHAVGEIRLVGYCFAPSYWGSAIQRLLSCDKPLITICRVLFCPKLFGECNFEAPVLPQATGELPFAWSCFASSRGELQFAGFPVKLLANYHLHVFAPCQAIGSSNFQGTDNVS